MTSFVWQQSICDVTSPKYSVLRLTPYSTSARSIPFYGIRSFERDPFPYFQDFSFLTRYISSDVPTMQIVDTSEKAFTPIPSDEIWLPIAIGSFFEIRGYGRVYTRANACDSFIYKHAADVIRIYPLIPFIFYSRAGSLHRENRCPSASPVVFQSVLST